MQRAALRPAFFNRIHLSGLAFYFLVSSSAPADLRPVPTLIEFSEEEQSYLRNHPEVRVGLDPDWPPFSFLDATGDVVGIDRDYLNLIEERTGLNFEYVANGPWSRIKADAQAGRLDLLTATSPTPERRKIFRFSEPYLKFPVAIVTRKDAPPVFDLDFVDDGLVALPKDYVTTSRFRERYPERQVLSVSSAREALLAVSRREADYTLENLVSSQTLIRAEGIVNLKVAGITDDLFALHFVTGTENPVLLSIINKGLATITPAEQHRILSQWVRVEHSDFIVWERFWKVAMPTVLLIGAAFLFLAIGALQLAREVKKRRQAERELQKAYAERDRILFTAIHDMNNPLTGISLLADQLEGSPEDTHRIEQIQDLSHRIVRLMRRLMLFRKSEAGEAVFSLTEININEVVEEIVELCQLQASRKQIRILARLSEEPIRIRGNRDALCQVLENLISNAVKFSQSGQRVKVVLQRIKEEAVIFVTDEGPGIAEAEQSLIWREFSSLSNRPTGGETSLGLGLSIVKELTEKMGGKVKCVSTLEKGSAFSVAFPLLQPEGTF